MIDVLIRWAKRQLEQAGLCALGPLRLYVGGAEDARVSVRGMATARQLYARPKAVDEFGGRVVSFKSLLGDGATALLGLTADG